MLSREFDKIIEKKVKRTLNIDIESEIIFIKWKLDKKKCNIIKVKID